MGEIVIYHNPRCSKSRQTLSLLREKGVQPRVVEYMDHPPTAEELKGLIRLLGIAPRDLLRRKEAEYKELGLADPAKSDDDIVRAMISHPRLMERPIVVNGPRAALGRPPERVLDIL